MRDHNWAPNEYDEAIVTRTTKTQIHLGKLRFRRKDGKPVGSDYYSNDTIYADTPENRTLFEENAAYARTERRENHLVSRLNGQRWRDVSLDKLERIEAILDEEDEE